MLSFAQPTHLVATLGAGAHDVAVRKKLVQSDAVQLLRFPLLQQLAPLQRPEDGLRDVQQATSASYLKMRMPFCCFWHRLLLASPVLIYLLRVALIGDVTRTQCFIA